MFSDTRAFRAIVIVAFAKVLFFAPLSRAEFFQECDSSQTALIVNRFLPSRLDEISKFTYAVETSPFATACQDPNSFRGRPKTGLFRRGVPLQDSKGRTSAVFLKRVGTSILASMTAEDAKLKEIEECLSTQPSLDCKPIRDWVKFELHPLVRTARMNLALAQTNAQISTLRFRANSDVNVAASALGTAKEIDWNPLSPEELATATSILRDYQNEVATETKRLVAEKTLSPSNAKEFANDALLATRYKNGLDYIESLARNRILQYLKSSSPDDAEILSAVRQMRKNLATDRTVAELAVKEIPNPGALVLMEYGSFVESELQRQPEDCAIAAALHYTNANRSTGTQLAIGVPLVVSAIALPIFGQALAGTAVAVTGSIGYTAHTKYNRDTVARRFASSLDGKSELEYQQLDQANHDYKVSVALMPLALGVAPLTSGATKFVMTGLRATRLGSKIASRSLQKAIAKQAD